MENLTSQVMNTKNEGVFDEFYLFYLDKLEKSLNVLLDKEYSFAFDKDKMMSEAICSLKNKLIETGAKALLVELQKYKEETKSDCTYKEYISFISDKEFHIYFDDKYSVLRELLEQKVADFVELYGECFTRLSADKKEIEEKFGITINSIQDLSFSVDGDTHNGGKSVIEIELNDGKKLFYKPHTLGMDIVFEDIIGVIEKRLVGFKYEHVKTIDKKDYGWQEKVEYKESKDLFDLRNYYYSIGVSLAIFYVLGTEDIHSGNLIAKGNMPAYIDLEILLANKNKSFGGVSLNEKYGDLKKVFIDSVLGTFILPNNTPTGLIDIDICALTSGQNLGKSSEKLSYFELTDKGTANIHYEKKQSEGYESLSIVRYQDEIVDADAYIDVIAEGFKDAYQVIMGEKDAILNIFKRHENEKIRQVVRATYVYGKFLDAACHPNYLKASEDRRRVISLIHGSKKPQGTMSKIIDKEMEMLYRDDIPYFYTKLNSCDLYCNYDGKESVVKKAYYNSLKEALDKKLQSLSEQDMYRQVDLIYASFANFGKHRIQKLERQDRQLWQKLRNGEEKDLPEKYVYAIYESLLEKCLEADDICTMIGLEPDIKDQYRITYLSGNLYNGLGVIYFLALADKKFGNKNADKILKLVRGIETISPYKYVPNNLGSSFNGLVGRMYVYHQMYELSGEKAYLKYYEEIKEYLLKTELQQEDVIDYVTGVCGGVVALANLYIKTKDKKLKKLIDRYKVFIKERVDNLDFANTLNGMAHGYSGFAIALFKIYEVTKEQYYYDKGVEFIKQENTSYSDEKGNWQDTRDGNYDMVYWCHGAAGIGFTRMATLKYVSQDEELKNLWLQNIDKSISMVIKSGLNFDMKHGLCHGVMGNMLILDYLAEGMQDQRLKAFVNEQLNEFLSRLEDDAIHYQNPLNVQDIGFMLGKSGIGYTIMKLIDEYIPNVLLFEA